MDRTLILVKPDAFERQLTGEVIARFERKGLRIAALKLMQVDRDLAQRHYAEHSEKPFFGELVDFITRGPLVAMVLEGTEAVKAARQVIGATNPLEAAMGSIRGDFATEVTFNLVHGSDSAGFGGTRGGVVLSGAVAGRRDRSGRPRCWSSLHALRSGRRFSRCSGFRSSSVPADVEELAEGAPRESWSRTRCARRARSRRIGPIRRPRGRHRGLPGRRGVRQGGGLGPRT